MQIIQGEKPQKPSLQYSYIISHHKATAFYFIYKENDTIAWPVYITIPQTHQNIVSPACQVANQTIRLEDNNLYFSATRGISEYGWIFVPCFYERSVQLLYCFHGIQLPFCSMVSAPVWFCCLFQLLQKLDSLHSKTLFNDIYVFIIKNKIKN